MISAGDFRPGVTVEIDGNACQVVNFQHVKPGKGAPFVKAKMKNLETGSTVERTFRPDEKFPRAHIDRREMQYLYKSDDLYYFMDTENYEQITLTDDDLGDAVLWMKENENIDVIFYKGRSIGVEVPNFVELEIIECDPGEKGNTVQGSTKPAKVETGAMVNVPFFVQQNEKIRIDTRTGEYMTRV